MTQTTCALIALTCYTTLTACGGAVDDVSMHTQPITGTATTSFTGLVAIAEAARPATTLTTGFLLSNQMVLTTKSALGGRVASTLRLTHGRGTTAVETRSGTDIIFHPSLDAAVVFVESGFSVPTAKPGAYAARIDDRAVSSLAGRTFECYNYDASGTLRRAALRVTGTGTATFSVASFQYSSGTDAGLPVSGGTLADVDRGAPCVDPNRVPLSHVGLTLSGQSQLALAPLRGWLADMVHLGRARVRSSAVLSLYLQTPSGQRMCADVASGSIADHAAVNQYPCHGGPAQRFYLDFTASGEFPALINARSGKCLDLCPGCTGFQQFSCHGGANQAFDMSYFATGSGIRFTVRSTGGCLAGGAGTAATTPSLRLSAPLCTLYATTNAHQRWFIQWL